MLAMHIDGGWPCSLQLTRFYCKEPPVYLAFVGDIFAKLRLGRTLIQEVSYFWGFQPAQTLLGYALPCIWMKGVPLIHSPYKLYCEGVAVYLTFVGCILAKVGNTKLSGEIRTQPLRLCKQIRVYKHTKQVLLRRETGWAFYGSVGCENMLC